MSDRLDLEAFRRYAKENFLKQGRLIANRYCNLAIQKITSLTAELEATRKERDELKANMVTQNITDIEMLNSLLEANTKALAYHSQLKRKNEDMHSTIKILQDTGEKLEAENSDLKAEVKDLNQHIELMRMRHRL